VEGLFFIFYVKVSASSQVSLSIRPQTNDTQNLTAEKGDGLTGSVIALRSSKGGKYVCVDGECLFATSTNITDSEKFYLITIDDGVALRSVLTGCYVSNPKYILGSDAIRCPDT